MSNRLHSDRPVSQRGLFHNEGQVLILLPTGRDGEGAAKLLNHAGIPNHRILQDSRAMLQALDTTSCGVLLIADEALNPTTLDALSDHLAQQPTWSDIPIIVLTRSVASVQSSHRLSMMRLSEALSNVMFLERPLHSMTLVSAVQTALNARSRQYQIRDHLIEKDRIADSLRQSMEQFQTLSETLPHMVWASDSVGTPYYFNQRMKDYTGLNPSRANLEQWIQLIHPDDRNRTRETWLYAVETGEPFELEFRLMGIDGQYGWFLSRAVPSYDDNGAITQWMGSLTDISDRKEWEQDLEETRDMAQQANQRKSQFLASMSHELRTPLNAILGYGGMLQKGTAGKITDKQARYAGNIVSSGKHLLNMVNEILDLSKIEAGKVELVLEPISLKDMMEEKLETFEPLAQQNNIRLSYWIEPGLETLYADAVRINQILLNLITNAIKFNRNGGWVEIRWRVEGPDWVVCEVEDSGIGIAQDKLPELFSEFYQIDNSYSRTQEGTGLGLVVTRRLVELHSGTIDVSSVEGEGTLFTVRLPRVD